MNFSLNWPRIPAALRDRAQWCITPGTDSDKAPRMTSGAHASSTDPSTWTTFEAACAEAARRGWHIGYVLHESDPFACIDLDVKDDTPPEVLELYGRIVKEMNSYTEASRSGKGAHIWVLGKIGAGCKRAGVELYSQERFIVCTGNVWNELPIEERQSLLTNMVSQMRVIEQELDIPDQPEDETDTEIIQRATAAANGEKFTALCKGEWKALGYPSQSEADMALLSILTFWSKSNAQVRRLFRQSELGKRKKAEDNRYLNRTILQARRRQEVERQRALAFTRSPGVQVVLQAIETTEALRAKAHGEAESAAPELSIDEMRKALVLVDGTYVAFLDNPPKMRTADAMAKHLLRNVTLIEDDKGNEKPTSTFGLWMKHQNRETAECFGFDPSEGRFFDNRRDHGKRALNLWKPLPRLPKGFEGMAVLAFPFIEHVTYLIPDEAEREWFLDWCAHIAQKPGELPHHHWLMWTPTHGIGRNTLCRILGRVFEGYVSENFQLSQFLKSGFNDDLSHRVLVFVDEVKEGINRHHEDKFKEMVTTDVRHINPKTFPVRHEKNCARWLLLSNWENALPISANDRRFNVVRNPDKSRTAAEYRHLNELVQDDMFIACVREWLMRRDISKFNPGREAVMNDAKRGVIAAGGPPEYQRARELVATHTADVIESHALFTAVFDHMPLPEHSGKWKTLAGIAESVGMVKLPTFNLGGAKFNVWALRNADEWKVMPNYTIAAELERHAS